MSMIEDMEDAPHTVLRCPECASLNLRQQNFCAKCGTPLWRPCLQCGAMCAVGENYCGACGANLEEMAVDQVEEAEASLRRVQELRSACRFDEAMAMLVLLTKNERPGLAEHIARAKQLMLDLTAERDRRRIETEKDCQLARERFAAFDVDGTAEILEGVPPPLCKGGVEEFRAEVVARRQEIAALHQELRLAVRQNRFLDLPPKIERLLVLKPDHAYGRQLAGKVQQHLVEAAEKCLAEHQYDQALGLLEQIAPHVRTERAEQLHRQIAELAWLAWDLRNAPVIDATLTAVAERLRRFGARDGRAAKLCAELQRRSRLVEGQGRGAPLPSARPPRQTPLGAPVEWLTGFRRIRRAEALEQPDLVQQAGRFAVACGLATDGAQTGSTADQPCIGRATRRPEPGYPIGALAERAAGLGDRSWPERIEGGQAGLGRKPAASGHRGCRPDRARQIAEPRRQRGRRKTIGRGDAPGISGPPRCQVGPGVRGDAGTAGTASLAGVAADRLGQGAEIRGIRGALSVPFSVGTVVLGLPAFRRPPGGRERRRKGRTRKPGGRC